MADIPTEDNRRGKRILVADDEHYMVRLIEANLQHAGYEVLRAFSGKEALEVIAAEKPDMLIVDAMEAYTGGFAIVKAIRAKLKSDDSQSYIDGFDVVRTVRADPATRSLPIIMFAETAQGSEIFSSWQDGADCYVEKPFDPIELLATIRRIFDALDSEQNTPMEWVKE